MISVGLELTGTSIKVAVLEGSAAKPKLQTFVARKIDAKKGDAEDDIVTVLKEVFKEAKAPKTGVVASVRAQDCMIREITVPFTAEDKIRKTVKYQAENYFTSLSIDDLIIEFSKFAEADERSKLLVAGIKKSLVARRLELLEEVGVDPQSIDLDVAALFNTYAHLGAFEDLGAALIVEVKAETLKIGVVEQGKLRLARAIRMRLGSMKLDALQPKPSMGMESGTYRSQAEESARLPVVILDEGDDEHFSLEDSGITEVEREGLLHRVFMEIDRTVATVQLTSEIDKIYLTGNSCALEGIEGVFSEHFEIDAERIDVAALLGGEGGLGKGGASLEAGTAIGLALKGLGVDHASMDFRQEEFAFKGAFAQIKKGVACLLTLLFAFTFLYAYGLKQERGEKNNRTDSVKGMQRHLYTVLFPDVTSETGHEPLENGGDNFAFALNLKRDALAAKYGGGGGSQGPTLSSLEILKHFSRAKLQVSPRFQIQVMQVTIDPKPTAQSTFVCRTSEEFGTVMLERRFKGHAVLIGKAGRIRALKEREGSGFQFEFIVKIRPPEEGPN